MRWMLLSVFFLALAIPIAAQEFNAGFVKGLWFADDQLFADKATRVYIAIRNNTGADLTGTVEFFDNDKRIGKTKVSALDGRIIESWADWTPSFGEHTITASLSRIELHQVGSDTEAVEVVSALDENIIFVDYDTDSDGIGNKQDTDDDDDGVSDEIEKANGTDPLDDNDPIPQKSSVSEPEDNGNSSSDENELNVTITTNSGDPEGLEQFIPESRAGAVLSSITDTVNTTRKKIDDYREERNSSISSTNDVQSTLSASTTATDISKATTAPDGINESGFGTVTRSKADGQGFFATVFDLAKALVSNLYTLVLFLLSLYLAYPVAVQLTLLGLILFLVYKLAKRYGSRPQ